MNVTDPYPGPRPFEREYETLFFGRAQERSDLLGLAMAHPAVLLYAESGAGKTSLLNAALVPDLEKAGCQILGPLRIGGDLPTGNGHGKVHNVFVHNAIAGLRQLPDAGASAGLTLLDYLGALPRPRKDRGPARPRVLLFDQMEELFTKHSDRWKDRAAFFDDLGAALEADPALRVVIALREEYVASLDPHAATLPGHLRTRYRMARLQKAAALEAIESPLAEFQREFEPEAAESVVNELLKVPAREGRGEGQSPVFAEFVDPVQLQVVCQDLWQSLPADRKTITKGDVAALGDVDRALTRYYEASLKVVMKQTGVAEGKLRRWFGQMLITPEATRATVYQGPTDTGGLPNDVVTELGKRYLIRPEPRGGKPWIELTHDRFIGPILDANRVWQATQDDAGAQYQRRAASWKERGKPKSELLQGRELAAAKRWQQSSEAKEVGVSDELRDLIAASDAARISERATKLIALIVSLGALALIFVLVLYSRARDSEARKEAAETQARLAERLSVAERLAKRDGGELDGLVFALRGTVPRAQARQALSAPEIELVRRLTADVTRARLISDPLEGAGQYALSNDGKWLLSTSPDHVRVWSTTDGRKPFTWPETDEKLDVENASFVASGKLIKVNAARRDERSLLVRMTVLLNPERGKELRDKERPRLESVSGDGKRVLVLKRSPPLLELVDVEKGTASSVEIAASTADLSRDGSRVAVSTLRKTVEIWAIDDAKPRQIVRSPHARGIFAPDGTTFAAYSRGGQDAQLYDARSGKMLGKASAPFNITYVTFGEDNRTIFLWGRTKTDGLVVVARDLGKSVSKPRVANSDDPISSPTGDHIFYEDNDDQTGNTFSLWRWDATTDHKTLLVPRLSFQTVTKAVTPDGRLAVTVSPAQTVRLWDTTQKVDTLAGRSFDDLVMLACKQLANEADIDLLRAEKICPGP